MDNKSCVAIYKIDTENNDFFRIGQQSPISILSAQIEGEGFVAQELQDNLADDFTVELFYRKNPSTPKWKYFLADILKDNQEILNKDQGWNESFAMLILNNTSNNLYAVVGGLGYHAVQDFIDNNFGVDVLSRLIKKDDKILKSVREKNVMGGILGTTKYFRKKYNLFENDSFGKFYQELKTDLDKNILKNYFGFSEDGLRSQSTCIAQASFKIDKSITFKQLIEIIKGCEHVLKNPENDPNLYPILINNVKKIIKKRDSDLIKSLENELFKQLWERYTESAFIDFDLCHKDFEKYLTASKYIVKRNNSLKNFFGNFEFKDEMKLENLDNLFQKIKELDDKPGSKDDFELLIRSLRIYSYNEEDENHELTKGGLIHHLFGDVSINSDKYFLIDGDWYQVGDDFIRELDNNCRSFIVNNFNDDGLNKKWDYSNNKEENKYNENFVGDSQTIVLDKVTPDNIEPCDILKWDGKNLYLYHVKAGFGNTIRDLCSQVFIAANQIKKDVNSSKEYVGKVYDQLQNKIGSSEKYFDKIGKQTQGISRDDFISLFTNKKIIFVLAVLDTAKTERGLRQNIGEFKSNIAKFSLQELVKAMRGIDVDFKITQIERIT